MKKKILAILLFAMMILTITGCGKENKDNTEYSNINENETVKKLYDMIEANHIPEVYPDFDTYKNNSFYMDKEIKYEDLNDESRLYYAYKTINAERKWFKSCDELKGYSYKNEDISTTCTKSAGEIIAKDHGSEEWYFYNVDKKALVNAYHTMYGEDKELPLKSFTMNSTGTCIYSKTQDDFLCFILQGGGSINYSETKLERYKENDDNIEIYDRYLWIGIDIDGEVYYKSHLNEEEKIDSTTKDFSKGALYKHTFKKDNQGNYYWYSSERVE